MTTPAYVYDLDGIAATVRELGAAFAGTAHLIAYAVKANTAGTVVRTVADAGGGADVVSAGELEVVLGAGVPPERVVMSGVAKLDDEIDAALHAGIHAVQVESVEEVARVAARSQTLGKPGRVSLRVNPSVQIDAHAHIATGHDDAKFGIPRGDLDAAWASIDDASQLTAVGVSTHVGSMLQSPDPYVESATAVCEEAKRRIESGKPLEFVDFGGGFGVDYGGKPCKHPAEFAKRALGLLRDQGLGDLQLVVEPGRAMVAPFGALVASTVQAKRSGPRRWLMIDAGMNDFIRPALYQSRHRIEPLDAEPEAGDWSVVGPVCESADDFGKHSLGETAPDAVVIRDVGAYGFTMASEYNGRALPAEVFVAGGRVKKVSPSRGRSGWAKARLDA